MNLKLSHLPLIATLVAIVMVNLLSCNRPRNKTTLYDAEEPFIEILNGNVKQITIGDSSLKETQGYNEYNFNDQGNLLNSRYKSYYTYQTEDGQHSTKFDHGSEYTFIADKNGKSIGITEISWSTNDADGRVEKTRWILDDKEKPITRIFYSNEDSPADSIGGRHSFKYDKAGNLIGLNMVSYNSHIGPITYALRYDKDKRVIASTTSEDGELVFQITYKYIQFDAHNNWTKRLAYINHYQSTSKIIIPDTTTRIITYY